MRILKDSAILSLKEFNKIKQDSKFEPRIHVSTSAINIFEQNKIQKALNHKIRIIEYDKNKKLETLKKLQEEESMKILENENKIPKEDDYIKQMDKMVLYAKIATIRDRQLIDKKKIKEINKQKEEKLDLLMELERLKDLKYQEEQKEKIIQKQREDTIILKEQIKNIQHERELEKELIEKEGKEMKKLMEKILEDEKKKLEKEKIKNEIKIRESLEANRLSILNKEKRKKEEEEEDRKIYEFNIAKAKKEEEIFQEKKRLEIKKELELSKIRDKQLKINDNKDELDSLRAKRTFEENERKIRKKELDDMINKKKKINELIRDNKRQIDTKELILAEEAMKEKEQFNKIIKEQIKEIDRLNEIEKKKKEQFVNHREELKKQILNKQEKEKIDRREILEEGRKIRQNNEEYKKNLEKVKKQRINYLKSLNIEDKYIVPLRIYKFGPELDN